jgi:NAD(P)H-dependent FMN reductase
MKVLALCGSLRRASMNATLLRAVTRLAPAGCAVQLFIPGELPLFNPDLDGPDPGVQAACPPAVLRLRTAIDASHAVLIASPEYAHGITGVIKNALDWLVSFEGFVGKPVAIFNASPRSVHAAASLREILLTMSATLLDDACLDLPLRGTGPTEQGIIDTYGPAIRQALDRLIEGASKT